MEIEKEIFRLLNDLLRKTVLYKRHLKSLENWEILKKQKKGICADCYIKTKTHLHHLNPYLRTENPRTIPLELFYVPIKDILYLTPKKIIKNYFERMDIEKTIEYFNVKESEVIEVCPKCHKKRHSELKKLLTKLGVFKK